MRVRSTFSRSLVCLLTTYALFASLSTGALEFEPPFGIKADCERVQALLPSVPTEIPLSQTKKSYLTLNKFGFDVMDQVTTDESWIIQDLLSFCSESAGPTLDVGGGYGRLSLAMYLHGAKEIIYNDIEEEHLLMGIKHMSSSAASSIYLDSRSFPQEMTFPPHSLKAVVLHRVLHFLPGTLIMRGIEKISQWLVDGGRVFIVVMAPQHSDFKDWFLPEYEKRWAAGEAWPGEGLNVSRALPQQAYNLPDALHVMDGRPLAKVLQKYNFIIEKEGFISMARYSSNRSGQEAYGIIAKYQPVKDEHRDL